MPDTGGLAPKVGRDSYGRTGGGGGGGVTCNSSHSSRV